MSIESLINIATQMLTGKEGVDFCYLESQIDDPEWWAYFKQVHRN